LPIHSPCGRHQLSLHRSYWPTLVCLTTIEVVVPYPAPHRRALVPACSVKRGPRRDVTVKENLMSSGSCVTDRQTPRPRSLSEAKEAAEMAIRSSNATRCCRFGRAIGFWLGGVLLGVGGCILGACLPYRHPVGVSISVVWWGIYFGCFGASVGAMLGMWTEQTPHLPSQGRREKGAKKHKEYTLIDRSASGPETTSQPDCDLLWSGRGFLFPPPLWGRVGVGGNGTPLPPPQPSPTRGEGENRNNGTV
jgi:hypothetical protein